MPKINRTVLVSGADYYTDKQPINALMDKVESVNSDRAMAEHKSIVDAYKTAGIKVIQVKPPAGCQDGIYAANWGLARNGKVILARLPNVRQPEEAYARSVFEKLGLEVIELPKSVKAFSGQGDCIACDNLIFCQSPYRTTLDAHEYITKYLGYEVIALHTKPARWFKFGPPKINKVTGWPDSPTYDIDLAISMIKPAEGTSKAVIAYCPAVFDKKSRKKLKALDNLDKIIVSKKEALGHYVQNLVSTGETVIMPAGAQNFKKELEKRGLKVIELSLPELHKGGGSIRCCSLTLN